MKKDVAMKTVITVLMCILLVLLLLVPVGVIVAASIGYSFRIFNISAFSLILGVLSVCLYILCVFNKKAVDKFTVCISFILPTVSLINAVVCILCYPKSFLAVATGTITAAVCCFLTAYKYVKRLPLKITAVVLPPVLIVIACFSGLTEPLFQNTFFKVGTDTVVQTVESPSGKYYAELIDDNQGALGGATRVWVYEKGGVNCAVFKMVKTPKEVYWGKWGEFKNMEIHWKDDSCLVINSKEYNLDNVN